MEFLVRTLELARTLLHSASDSRNDEHVVFCRRAAREFHATVHRLLPYFDASGREGREIHATMTALGAELEAMGY